MLFIFSYAIPAQATKRDNSAVLSKSKTEKKSVVHKRMKTREMLLARAKKNKIDDVPLTPRQKQKWVSEQIANRASNRERLMHTRWRPGRFGGSDNLWQPLPGEELLVEAGSPRVEAAIRKVVQRLKMQLGKPYVWGGETPTEGFDCSGLVFYAYNPLLSRKIPRTANSMYQKNDLKRVSANRLRRGDLLFFSIHTSRDKADHVGVYLGDGQFIEAPRTGLNIRISQLDDAFWQDHYIGARRILTDDAVI